jgi:hypothetical protein
MTGLLFHVFNRENLNNLATADAPVTFLDHPSPTRHNFSRRVSGAPEIDYQLAARSGTERLTFGDQNAAKIQTARIVEVVIRSVITPARSLHLSI